VPERPSPPPSLRDTSPVTTGEENYGAVDFFLPHLYGGDGAPPKRRDEGGAGVNHRDDSARGGDDGAHDHARDDDRHDHHQDDESARPFGGYR